MSPTTQPWTSTATELIALLRSGDLSATELTRSLLDRIEHVEGDVRAFITVTPEIALAKAKEVDDARARGEDPGPIAGVPVAVKDIIATKGVRTTAGSRILHN